MNAVWWSSVVLALLLAGCAGGKSKSVDLTDNQFEEDGKNILFLRESSANPSLTITFTNRGLADHTVTVHLPPAASTEFVHDQALSPGAKTSFKFDQLATYHVFCKNHGGIGTGMNFEVTLAKL